jgi:SAM-dependent methyltransferase
MKVLCESIPEIDRYIQNKKHLFLRDYEVNFREYLAVIRRFITIEEDTKILEIGTGTGWFPILCQMEGISCKGLEISPQLIAYARELGRPLGIEPDIELGNIEERSIGTELYDVIIAQSVFEHVEYWEKAIQNVFSALRPGGLFLFSSTNKFSFVSGEHNFPLYGWLPDRWRYRLRIARQGPEIMKLGIDFNQFTYPQLRRTFKKVGFSRVLDRVEISSPDQVACPWKRAVLRACKRLRLLNKFVLCFSHLTTFACTK